jgi:hypothetical protein
MSKNEQLILGILGTAIVLVYGFLGAYVLIYLTDGVSTQTAESPPAGLSASDTHLPNPDSTTSPAQQAPSDAPEGAAPTNTRVLPLGSPAAGTPAPAATPSAEAPQSATTPLPAQPAGPSPTSPAQATSTTAPGPSPPPPFPSPTPDASCVDDENAHHQQMLADIEAEYASTLTWIQAGMDQATRDGDYLRVEELQLELDMCQDLMAGGISAENARHEAALAACNP